MTVAQVEAAFSGAGRRSRVSFFYLIGLAIIALAMVALPIVYLAVIVLVGWAVVYHAQHHTWIFGRGGVGYVAFGRMIAYVGPMIIGALAILFMLKPLFVRIREEEEPLTLVRSQEPTLFALIDRLCEAIGAPAPREIEVEVSMNAAAALRRGFVSLFSRDLKLIIGLSMVSGLTANQFVSVMAHELGHFSQGFGMRLTYVIHRINHWFGRVVYERDAWDDNLVEWSSNNDGRVAIVFWLTRIMVWLSRRVLWVLMVIARMISCGMSRQMEYDADRRAADVVGDAVVASTLLRTDILGMTYAQVHHELLLSWQSKRLADSLPMMVALRANSIPKAIRKQVEAAMLEEKSGLFSTHPSTARRIANVQARPTPGVFHLDAPARLLFSNFKMVGNAVTLTHYRSGLGLPIDGKNLVPTEALIAQHEAEAAQQTSLSRYFQGLLSTSVEPFKLELQSLLPPEKPKEMLLLLRKVRQRFEAGLAEWPGVFRTGRTLWRRRYMYYAAQAMLRAGFKKLDRKSFGIEFTSREEIDAEIGRIGQLLGPLSETMASAHKVLRARMTFALRLLLVPAVSAKLPESEKVIADVRRWTRTLRQLEKVLRLHAEFGGDQGILSLLLEQKAEIGSAEDQPVTLDATIRSFTDSVTSKMEDVLSYLDSEPYPFDHAESGMTVARYVLKEFRRSARPIDIARQADAASDRIELLHHQLLGRLAAVAEMVERIAGLKPLEEPDETASMPAETMEAA